TASIDSLPGTASEPPRTTSLTCNASAHAASSTASQPASTGNSRRGGAARTMLSMALTRTALEQARRLDPAGMRGEGTHAARMELDDGRQGLRALLPSGTKVGIERDETLQHRLAVRVGEVRGRCDVGFEDELRVYVRVCGFLEGQAERVRDLRERGIRVQTLLDVLRVDVGAHDRDGVIAAAVNPE